MKNMVLILSLLAAFVPSYAQKSSVRTGREYLQDNNYRKAIKELDAAVMHEDTKTSADAWFWRGTAYLMMALDTTVQSETAVPEATKSFLKALSLDPEYGKELDQQMYSAAILNFNKGVTDFSSKAYSNAYEDFMTVNDLYNRGGAKRFGDNNSFKQLATDAKKNAAYAAMNSERYQDAQLLLEDIIKQQPDSIDYEQLIGVYQKLGKDKELLELIQTARKQFPASRFFRDTELNYYISKGDRTTLLGMLEAAVQQDPGNGELWFNLSNAYEAAADAEDGAPASGEWFKKAEQGYTKAVSIAPNQPDYNYNFGVLYYKAAAGYIKMLAEIKGTSAEENRRYDELTALRNGMFDKGLPYFERSYHLLEPRSASLSAEEMITYRNTLTGLREIYSRLDNKKGLEEIKQKIDGLK